MNDDLYRENILDHNADPRHFGAIEDADVDEGKVNVSCGDEVRVQLKLDGDRVAEMHFTGRGCAISQASTSMLTEKIRGETIETILGWGPDDITAMLGVTLSPSRMRCALLGLETVKRGLEKRGNASHD